MTKKAFRSNCPLSCSMDILGDKWTLVILRDMVFFGKETFKELAASEEEIATNILAARLKQLVAYGLVTKTRSETNKKVFLYQLTGKGIALLPVLIELVLWSADHLPADNPQLRVSGLDAIRANKEAVIANIKKGWEQSQLA